MAMLGGVQLIVLGLLGEYVWRVAEQTRERPRFFIMNRTGFQPEINPGLARERYQPHTFEQLSKSNEQASKPDSDAVPIFENAGQDSE